MLDLLILPSGAAVLALFSLLLIGWIFNLPAWWLRFIAGFAVGELLVILLWILEHKHTAAG